MRTFFYMPPLKTITGGMYVIADMARQLLDAGWQSALVVNSSSQFQNVNWANLPQIPIDTLKLEPDDRWFVPEGWPNALIHGLQAKAQCCVYVQNWAFLLGQLPPGVTWNQLPLRMISVSDPVALFIYETTSITAPIIRPAIDSSIFFPDSSKKIDKKIRIAWMPRKNKGLAKQIQQAWASRACAFSLPECEWVEIQGCSREGVAKILRECDVFLATGFPEGCALPPLEAMACGCLLAGFAGMGDWDYMRQALPGGYKPSFPLREVPWGANGFYAADADILGALLCLEAAVITSKERNENFAALRESGFQTAAYYSYQRQASEVLKLWEDEAFWAQ